MVQRTKHNYRTTQRKGPGTLVKSLPPQVETVEVDMEMIKAKYKEKMENEAKRRIEEAKAQVEAVRKIARPGPYDFGYGLYEEEYLWRSRK